MGLREQGMASEVISSIIAKLEMAKNVHLQIDKKLPFGYPQPMFIP
jgi:hypothetical protein